MPKPVTVTVSTKVVTAAGLSAKAAEAFDHLVPSGKLEMVLENHDATGLLPKEAKELAAFCEFARRPEFRSTIRRLTGTESGGVLQLESLSSAAGEDPPDLRLKLGGAVLAIEVSDFPPDQAAMAQAIMKVQDASPLPPLHEGGCCPELIEKFMRAEVSLTQPHLASANDEAYALALCADQLLGAKDQTVKSDLLLLHGPLAFA